MRPEKINLGIVKFCAEEVDYILSLGGITIQYNKALGKDITLAGLQKDYDAVYLAFGVGLARQPEGQLRGLEHAGDLHPSGGLNGGINPRFGSQSLTLGEKS